MLSLSPRALRVVRVSSSFSTNQPILLRPRTTNSLLSISISCLRCAVSDKADPVSSQEEESCQAGQVAVRSLSLAITSTGSAAVPTVEIYKKPLSHSCLMLQSDQNRSQTWHYLLKDHSICLGRDYFLVGDIISVGFSGPGAWLCHCHYAAITRSKISSGAHWTDKFSCVKGSE